MFLCRDEDGLLHMIVGKHVPVIAIYERIAVWRYDESIDDDYNDIQLNREQYPNVTFDNSPIEVELKLIEK